MNALKTEHPGSAEFPESGVESAIGTRSAPLPREMQLFRYWRDGFGLAGDFLAFYARTREMWTSGAMIPGELFALVRPEAPSLAGPCANLEPRRRRRHFARRPRLRGEPRS